MKILNPALLTILSLISSGITVKAQENQDDLIVSHAPRSVQMVRFFKPTQTYYGKGYVIRYGYSSTTPLAAGYTQVASNSTFASDQYLRVANSGSRKEIMVFRKTVTPAVKKDQQNKPDVQPGKEQKPQQ